jgi:hypothetical protein
MILFVVGLIVCCCVVVEMVGEWGDLQPRSSEENHEKARLSHPERLRSHCPSGKLQLLHDVQPKNEKTY